MGLPLAGLFAYFVSIRYEVGIQTFRSWLLQFHPLLVGGWSWHLWLSAGNPFLSGSWVSCTKPVLEAVRREGEGLSFEYPDTYDELDEEVSLRPWLREALVSVNTILAAGEHRLITPFLSYAPPRRNLRRRRALQLEGDIGQRRRMTLLRSSCPALFQ